jgi:fructokinase
VEQFLSGPGMTAAHARLTGRPMPAAAIAAAAADGEPAAAATLADYIDRLVAVLGMVVTLIDPDAIVLGGGVSRIDALYPAVTAQLPAATFGGEAPTMVRPPRHGDSSGVRGAAWLWGRPDAASAR